MTIHLITFASALLKQQSVLSSHEVILNELEKYFTVRIIDPDHIRLLMPSDFAIVFIASGGVERMVISRFEQLPRPTVILADGMQNSLASALEVHSWLRNRGMQSEILHGNLTGIIKRLLVLHQNFKAANALRGTRIGVIGTPSPWLIASGADYLLAKRRWGVNFVDIPLEQLVERYEQVTDDEVGDLTAYVASHALACRESTPEQLLKAMRCYQALRQLAQEQRLNALTLSCFKLIDEIGTTGCLALSLLNDAGITAGCEGDLQTVFTMHVARTITSQPGFMANVSLIHDTSNEVVLAHCTVGLKQTEQYILRNHFETESGIGIQGLLPTGDVTLLKIGGESLDEYYLNTGTLTENTNYINLCRTQVKVRLDGSVNYFYRRPLGNHHVLLSGNHATLLNGFLQGFGCRKV
ncbi:MAG: fucose isomerase [Bacteroides sp.]